MNIKRIRHKVAKAQSGKAKEKNSVPPRLPIFGGQVCLCAFVPDKTGFTLMELLVVIAIMGVLAGILMPSLSAGRERARRAVCMGNLKVIGEAFNMYNIDQGEMPTTLEIAGSNDATNQIGIGGGATIVPVGLGYFYYDKYVEDFGVYVCPSSNYIRISQAVKQDWGNPNNTYSAYIYRAESGYTAALPAPQATLILSDAKPAIVMDYNTITGPFYNHKGEYVNILFKNGNVKGVENPAAVADTLTLQAISTAEKDRVFEDAADELQ